MKALACLLLSGCAIGAGGSSVGEWRAKRVVESTACLETSPGVCGKTVVIGSEQPPRSFGGGIFTFSAPGYARAETRGTSESAFVLDGSFEYLRGRGSFALGARIGLTLVDGQQHSWLVMPVTAMAYWGGAWGTVFAGVGYAPLATVSAVGVSTTYEHDGVEALIGTRIMLRETLGVSISFSPEVRYQLVGDSTLISAVGSLGLHF